MKAKFGTTVLSAAIASGLLLSGTAAQAAEVFEESLAAQESVAESLEVETSGETETDAAVAGKVAAEPSVVSSDTEASPQPVPEESSVGVDQPVEESPEPAVQASPETEDPQVEISKEAELSEPAAEETKAAQVPVQKAVEPVAPVAKSVAPVSSEPSKESSTSFGVVSLDDRWDEVDALLPEGSEDWSDEQWEVFFETEAGEEYIRQVDELLAEEYSAEDDFELSEEEQAFWESIFASLPEESIEWDEAQWEEYFQGDAGVELIIQMLPVIVDSIETDEDAADLQEFLEDVFANDPEQLAYYLELYLGITPEVTGGSTSGSETAEEPVASESARPVAEAEIKPAASITKSIVSKAKSVKKPAQASVAEAAESPVLADTGFGGFWAVGLGALLAIAGAVFVARSRKVSAK